MHAMIDKITIKAAMITSDQHELDTAVTAVVTAVTPAAVAVPPMPAAAAAALAEVTEVTVALPAAKGLSYVP